MTNNCETNISIYFNSFKPDFFLRKKFFLHYLIINISKNIVDIFYVFIVNFTWNIGRVT